MTLVGVIDLPQSKVMSTDLKTQSFIFKSVNQKNQTNNQRYKKMQGYCNLAQNKIQHEAMVVLIIQKCVSKWAERLFKDSLY